MDNDSTFLAGQILQIIPRVMRILAADLRTKGKMLTPSHFGVLVMLHFRPSNLSELAEYQNVSLPTMSKTVSSLVEKGWVRRSRSSADRRYVMVELSEDGLQKLDDINCQATSSLAVLLEDVTEEERLVLASGLDILCRLFELEDLSTPGSSDDFGGSINDFVQSDPPSGTKSPNPPSTSDPGQSLQE